MSFFDRSLAILMTFVMIGYVVPLEAKTRKGDRFLAEGRGHEEKKEWDAAVDAYERALSEDPGELTYQMAAEKARFQASTMHMTKGVRIREQGQLGEALLEFQKAYALSPSSSAAQQEIVRTQGMIERERKRVELTGKEGSPEVRGMTPTELARKELDDKIARLLPLPELKPLRPTLQDFKINNQTPRYIFETLALNAGLNVIWDPEYVINGPKDKLNISFANSTVQEALDYAAVLTKSYWKPLSANTIFITMDTQAKRRDFEDEVTRIFYLTNITANVDLTAILNAVRQVADCQRVFPIESLGVIVAKCAADKMALTEKIVHDLDKARAEVVVDIFVIEASSVYIRNLTTSIASTGFNMPLNSTPRASLQVQQAATTTTASTTTSNSTVATTTPSTTSSTTSGSSTTGAAIPISHIGQLNAGDFSTILPNALFQATLSDTKTKVLQSPQLRSVDGQKVSMKIGEREPTAGSSFQPGLGSGAGLSPLINTQFNYLDVGVNVDILPHVHENGDVSMQINLDISSVTGTKNLGGIDEPIIGQRKIEQFIRLREGEVSLLSGLLNQQDSKVKTGVPGLSRIPGLGRFFSGESVDRERDELVIALIPHVVRRPDVTPQNLSAVSSGTSSQLQVRLGPKAAEPDLPPPAVAPAAPAPAGPPPTEMPVQPAASAKIHFNEAQLDKKIGDTFSVTIQVENARDVVSTPIQLRFDPKILSLNSVAPGNFWSSDGEETLVARNLQNDLGIANVLLSRKPGSASVAGSGTLLTLNFQAIAPGATTVSGTNITLNNAQNQIVASGSPSITIHVQ